MTLTWRTLRDYALRIATYLAVILAAFSIPIPLLAVAIYVMRFYWLAWVQSNVQMLTGALFIAYAVLVSILLIPSARWRKEWLWRRWYIRVG